MIYVANFSGTGDGQITPVATPASGPPAKLNSFPAGRTPIFPAVDPTGRAVVTPDYVNGTVGVTAVCDSGSGAEFKAGNAVPGGISPYRVAVSPRPATVTGDVRTYAAYVADAGAPNVRRVDVTIVKDPCAATVSLPTNSITPVGGNPTSLAISPDGATAYVTVPSLNAVVPVRLDTGTPLAPIPVGKGPRAIAFTPNGYVAFVVNAGSNSVTPIYEGKAMTEIAVGPNPQEIAITPDGTMAYVANGDETITPIIITANGANVLAPAPPITIGAVPTGLTISPDGKTLWATSYAASKVLPIDIASGTVGSTLTGFRNPIGVVANPDQAPEAKIALTSTTSVACSGGVPYGVASQVCLGLGGSVTLNASGSQPRTTPIVKYEWSFGDGSPSQVTTTPSTTHSYANPGTYVASVTLTDSAGTSLQQAFTGQTVSRNGGPQVISYGLVKIIAEPIPVNTPLFYVANGLGDQLTPVALPASGTAQIGNAFPAGRLPTFPAATSDGMAVVSPNYTTGELTATAVCAEGGFLKFEKGNTLSAGIEPNWVAISRDPIATAAFQKTWTVLVANKGGGEVRQFLLTTSSLSGVCGAFLSAPLSNSVIPVGPNPYGIVISGTTAYVTVSGLDAVVPIDLATSTPGKPIKVGSDPRGIAISPDGKTVYVANYGSGSVTPIDTAGQRARAAIPVGPHPLSIAINPAGTLAMVANNGGLTVTPIALLTEIPGTEISVPTPPVAIAFDASGATAYVTSYFGNSLIPINAATKVAGTPMMGVAAPLGIAVSGGVSTL
jgi:YVTN family beta-propeller protein